MTAAAAGRRWRLTMWWPGLSYVFVGSLAEIRRHLHARAMPYAWLATARPRRRAAP